LASVSLIAATCHSCSARYLAIASWPRNDTLRFVASARAFSRSISSLEARIVIVADAVVCTSSADVHILSAWLDSPSAGSGSGRR
jgi:hypothetical protein